MKDDEEQFWKDWYEEKEREEEDGRRKGNRVLRVLGWLFWILMFYCLVFTCNIPG